VQLRVFTEPQEGADYGTLLRVAQTTEQCGFDGFFRSDHYLKIGPEGGLPGPTDAWVTLAGLARETTRIRLGTLVTPAMFRLPGPLAIMVATVDQMSGGRIELGLGAGWYEAEHQAHGIPFPATRERFDRLEEQLQIITGLWSTPIGESFSFDGAYYQLHDSPALPKPYAGKPPVIIGGFGSRRTPRLTARFADEYNLPFSNVADAGAAFERVRAACASEGRSDEPIYSVAQTVCCGRDDAELARRAGAIGRDVEQLRAYALAGSPAELVDKIGEFGALGCRRMYLQVLDLDDLDHIELLASEVLLRV